jgi:hypothetical protein
MGKKTAEEIAAEKKAKETAAQKAKARKAKLQKQIVDLSTFKKKDAVKWTSKTPRQTRQNTAATGLSGLKSLGQTTRIKRASSYPKTRKA